MLQDKEAERTIDILCARLGCRLTEEQKEFAWNFTEPLISFSNPGSGKTHSAIIGLIMAQTYHGIKGSRINAMSFTRLATAELANRYTKACKLAGLAPTVTFNTFHSICRKILQEQYPTMQIRGGIDYSKDLDILEQYVKEIEPSYINDKYFIRNLLEAINSLNASLAFDESNIIRSLKFNKLGMTIEQFNSVRAKWFNLGLATRSITQGDIPLYCLYALLLNPDIQEKYKRKYQIMVVDEFQDMSLLYLKILSLISRNVVAIGDMKQQIYAFNGASQQIVEEYLRIYPNARKVALTHSFRCKDEICEFSTSIIEPNKPEVMEFTGMGSGGSINIIPFKSMDLKTIISNIKVEQDRLAVLSSSQLMQDSNKMRDIMFLFRNNFSATPVAEELYKQGVHFRMNKFARVMDIPIFEDLCKLADAALEDKDIAKVEIALKLFPEFRYQSGKNPVLETMRISGKGLLDVPYRYREQSSYDLLNAMKTARVKIDRGEMSNVVLASLLNVYDAHIIKGKWWTLDMPKEFYFNLVSPVLQSKTYQVMVAEENDKMGKITNCTATGVGVRCYTMHNSKGLEADDVYIIDCEQSILPSAKNMKKYIEAGCEYEAAKDLRNERNLLYVAITRAKENVFISYGSEISSLIASPKSNSYSYLDGIYEAANNNFDDVGAFKKLFRLEG